jgi:hypothetical protein
MYFMQQALYVHVFEGFFCSSSLVIYIDKNDHFSLWAGLVLITGEGSQT